MIALPCHCCWIDKDRFFQFLAPKCCKTVVPLRVSVGSGSSLWCCFQSMYREFNRELLVTDLSLSFFHSFLSILHSFCGSLFDLTSHLLPHYSFQSGLKSSANYGCVATLKMTCVAPQVAALASVLVAPIAGCSVQVRRTG